jgi:multiple sugar transport system substrate-binding protein
VPRTKRYLASVVFLCLAALASNACAVLGGQPSDPRDSLEFWMYQPSTPQGAKVFDTLKRDFEKANGVTLKLVQVPKDDYNTKLATALSGAGGPDAGYLDQPLVARFASDGTIREVPAGTADERAYFTGALETNRVGGKLYGLPLDHTTVALFYNKKLVPQPPRTWDELRRVTTAVHRADRNVAGHIQAP